MARSKGQEDNRRRPATAGKRAPAAKQAPTERQAPATRPSPAKKQGEKLCFVMMPFTEPDGYPADHFKRVYRYIIQPACELAGYRPVRVDDINTSNHIVIEIIRYIVEAEMAICDLSARSPNVLYELGIRHAFNKPVTLIKDARTSRMFDIQGLRDIEYDDSLRADTIEKVIPVVADSLVNNLATHVEGPSAANSVINLLGVKPAELPEVVELSHESGLILSALSEIRDRMARLEQLATLRAASDGIPPLGSILNQNGDGRGARPGELATQGSGPMRFVQHREFGIGILRTHEEDGRAIVDFLNEGMKLVDPAELKQISLMGE